MWTSTSSDYNYNPPFLSSILGFHSATLLPPLSSFPICLLLWTLFCVMKAWTVERERLMLLLTMSTANVKPSAEIWHSVAVLLGDVSASAVRSGACCFFLYQLQGQSICN